jgi:hypothetical protein
LKNYVVYQHPRDYPNDYVMRVFEVTSAGATPTDEVVVSPSLKLVRQSIPPGCICISRSIGDDPVILETWL